MTSPSRWHHGFAAAAALVVVSGSARAQDSAATAGAGHRFFPLPFVFYQPETGFGGGAALLHTYRAAPTARTSTNQITLVYTAKRQYSARLQAEWYLRGGRYVAAGELLGSHFPDLFFGVGNATRATDEERYTLDQVRGAVEGRVALAPGVYAGVAYRYQWTAAKDLDTAGALITGELPGWDGGTVAGAGLRLSVDTRDHTLGPTRGVFLQGGASVHHGRFGSDFDYQRYELDARGYVPLAPGHVAAVQVLLTSQTDDPPFFELATLGGDAVFRGSYQGRFRDRGRAVAQAEYRVDVIGPVGAVLFGAAGQVRRSWSGFALRDLHLAGGGGVRWRLSRTERVNLRIDVGFGPGESGFYFALGEAF
jgi:outer membrane protein assembly factor BamA